MGEFELIARYFAQDTPQTLLGPGDDCALVCPSPGMALAVTTDMLVEGTHFFSDTGPHDLGWKTLAVNLSDLAAMGANPRWAVLAGSLPSADEHWLSFFSAGFHACARRFGVDLIGGDTTRGPLNLCVTAIGEIPAGQALRRDNARVGDDIWVSGQLGLAALGLKCLQGQIELVPPLRQRCLEHLQAPQPRVALGLALRALANAAIDVSDGLLADLGHIAHRSGLFARVMLGRLPPLPAGVDRDVALEALLCGGDDYELCFTAPPERRFSLEHLADGTETFDRDIPNRGIPALDIPALDIPLWRIGTLSAPNETDPAGHVRLLDLDGREIEWTRKGYDHFCNQD
jgi:thiamine-monophosphate kinase